MAGGGWRIWLAKSRVRVLKSAWKNIVGAQLAEFCVPYKISYDKNNNATVHLEVASGLQTQIMHMKEIIIARIAVHLGDNFVKDLAIKQSYKKTALLPNKSKAKNENLSDEFNNILQDIDDEGLKNSLENLARGIYNRDRGECLK